MKKRVIVRMDLTSRSQIWARLGKIHAPIPAGSLKVHACILYEMCQDFYFNCVCVFKLDLGLCFAVDSQDLSKKDGGDDG